MIFLSKHKSTSVIEIVCHTHDMSHFYPSISKYFSFYPGTFWFCIGRFEQPGVNF